MEASFVGENMPHLNPHHHYSSVSPYQSCSPFDQQHSMNNNLSSFMKPNSMPMLDSIDGSDFGDDFDFFGSSGSSNSMTPTNNGMSGGGGVNQQNGISQMQQQYQQQLHPVPPPPQSQQQQPHEPLPQHQVTGHSNQYAMYENSYNQHQQSHPETHRNSATNHPQFYQQQQMYNNSCEASLYNEQQQNPQQYGYQQSQPEQQQQQLQPQHHQHHHHQHQQSQKDPYSGYQSYDHSFHKNQQTSHPHIPSSSPTLLSLLNSSSSPPYSSSSSTSSTSSAREIKSEMPIHTRAIPCSNNKSSNNQNPVRVPLIKKEKKNGKKRRDPNEPQKPVSAYALFFRDTQAVIKGNQPSASFGEVSKIVASMWDSLDPDSKAEYKKRTEQAKKEYLKALAAYRASLITTSPGILISK